MPTPGSKLILIPLSSVLALPVSESLLAPPTTAETVLTVVAVVVGCPATAAAAPLSGYCTDENKSSLFPDDGRLLE